MYICEIYSYISVIFLCSVWAKNHCNSFEKITVYIRATNIMHIIIKIVLSESIEGIISLAFSIRCSYTYNFYFVHCIISFSRLLLRILWFALQKSQYRISFANQTVKFCFLTVFSVENDIDLTAQLLIP